MYMEQRSQSLPRSDVTLARSDLAVADGLRPHVGASNGTKLTVSIDQMCTSEAAMEAR